MAAAGRSQLDVEFIDQTYLELYRRAWETLVAPRPLPWVLALTVFEAAVGAATLRRGRVRLIGLAASAVFVAVLPPAGRPYTLGNPGLSALPASCSSGIFAPSVRRHLRTRSEAEMRIVLAVFLLGTRPCTGDVDAAVHRRDQRHAVRSRSLLAVG